MSWGHINSKTLNQRFWEKVEKTKGCWIWEATTFKNGYGRFFVPKEEGGYSAGLAHRVSWSFKDDTLTKKDTLLHTCDTKLCVRNDEEGTYEVNGIILPRWGHLVKGKTAHNLADMRQKGRANDARGIDNGLHIFTEDEVREIRKLNQGGLGKRKIAAMYDCAENTIHCIVRYKTWKHI